MTHRRREFARFVNEAQRDVAVSRANRLDRELAAYRDLEAATRAWLADFDNRYDGEGLPNLREIEALKAAIDALDRTRR